MKTTSSTPWPPKPYQPKKNTEAQAQAMAFMCCSHTIIARRLGISERHARRLTQGQTIIPNVLIGTDQEWLVWQNAYRVFLSYRKTAWYFGVSHETIRKTLHPHTELFKSKT